MRGFLHSLYLAIAFTVCTLSSNAEDNGLSGDPNLSDTATTSTDTVQSTTSAKDSFNVWDTGTMKSSDFFTSGQYGQAVNRGILLNADSVVKAAKQYTQNQDALVGQSVHESNIKHIESFISFQGLLVNALKIGVYIFLFIALLRIGVMVQTHNVQGALKLAIGIGIAIAVITLLPQYISVLSNLTSY